MASLLSVQTKDEKIKLYTDICRKMGIKVSTPDVNKSRRDFTAIDGKILYGLGSIKGVGETSIDEIINNRPYRDLEDISTKLPKKVFNKRVGESLIKSGALDSFQKNRYKLLNEYYDIRKDKIDRLDTEAYTNEVCMEMEKDTLSTPITYLPWWDNIKANKTINQECVVESVREITDKNGRLMAFVKLTMNECAIEGVLFANQYSQFAGLLDKKYFSKLIVKGKKDDKGGLIINKIAPAAENPLDKVFENIV